MDILKQIAQYGLYTVAGVIFASIFYWRNKKRSEKAFAFKILIDTPLISHQEAAEGKVQIMFKGKEVKNVRLIEVELRSSGEKEITANDFDYPITLRFPDDAEVLEASVSEHFPAAFIPEIEINPTFVTLKPKVMNRGDRLKIKVLVTIQEDQKVKVQGHISGIPELTDTEPIWTPRNILRASLPIWVTIFIVATFSLLNYLDPNQKPIFPEPPTSKTHLFPVLVITAVILTCITTHLVYQEEKNKRKETW
jgi:hypothetical protein